MGTFSCPVEASNRPRCPVVTCWTRWRHELSVLAAGCTTWNGSITVRAAGADFAAAARYAANLSMVTTGRDDVARPDGGVGENKDGAAAPAPESR